LWEYNLRVAEQLTEEQVCGKCKAFVPYKEGEEGWNLGAVAIDGLGRPGRCPAKRHPVVMANWTPRQTEEHNANFHPETYEPENTFVSCFVPALLASEGVESGAAVGVIDN
jgi:hypothetical protein